MASLYFDADIKPTFRLVLPAGAHDVVTTHELGRIAALDAEQLVTATELGRVLITHNGKDFRTLCQAWRIWRRVWGLEPAEHAGVLAFPQQTLLPYPQAAAEVDLLLQQQGRVWNELWFYDLSVGGWVRQV